MSRPELTILDHREAAAYFSQLITDLMKREMGLGHQPITMKRLEEAAEHINDIRQCQRPAVIRRARPGEWRRGCGAGAEYEVGDETGID